MWTQDFRYALRLLRRSKGFATTAILTLALSIGANAAIWSAVKGILVAPLPYADPDRLVRLFEESQRSPKWPFAPSDFRDYRSELTKFEGIAAYFRADLQLGGTDGPPEQLRGMQVTAGYFGLLGHPPRLGRDFTEDDELKGNGDKVILSHGLWMRRFDGDPNVIGRTTRMSGKQLEIVGVLPQGFQNVGSTFRSYGHAEPVDVWAPLPVPRDEIPSNRFSHFYNTVARVKPNVTRAEMQADLDAAGKSAATRYPVPNSPWKPKAVPLKDEIVGNSQQTLLVLSSAALAMLLLACVNVAGLMLGRANARTREIGTRAALGATRWRLARQLLIESLVLATAGATAGIAIAFGAVRMLRAFGPSDMPRLHEIGIDAGILLLTTAATLGSALLVGLAPAIRLARTTLSEALKEGARTTTGGHHNAGKALAAAEVALAFVLVVSSGLLLRSFTKIISKAPGFQPEGALTVTLEVPPAKYDGPAARAFYARAQERLQALPGAKHVTFTSDLPWTGWNENSGFEIPGRTFRRGEGPSVRYHFTSPGYTKTTGTPLVAGRDLTEQDQRDAPKVVLINEAAAKKYWNTPEAATGAELEMWGEKRTVAGVIGDVTDMPWNDSAAPALYFPVQQAWYHQRMTLVVRADGDPMRLVEPIRKALAEIDPELPIANVKLLETVAAGALATRRLTLWLVATFGISALLLAVVGVYGVMAQAVGQRSHEFGVRQALGATRADIMKLVFGSAATMTIGGLAIGLALAVGSTRLMMSLLYGVTPLDAVTFVGVALTLMTAAAGAIYLPALRATKVSAILALRRD
jgi:predicted permease